MIIVDASIAPLLAKALPEMKTVEHVLVVGRRRRRAGRAGTGHLALRGRRRRAADDVRLAHDLDERSAAAMCYTSGTTGNPKGVVYSHRSVYLHSMAACMGSAFGVSEPDRVLPVVPMFHANAWGLLYAAWMAGADMIMPDRFLQAEYLCPLMTERAADRRRGRTDRLVGSAAACGREQARYLLHPHGDLRRFGRSAVAHEGLPGAARRARHPGLGDDRDLPAGGIAHPPAGRQQR